MIEWLFSSGHAADIVLGVLAIEALWLRRLGWRWQAIALALGPAVLIVLGLRASLVGASWLWIALPLAASGPLHLIDIKRRNAAAAKAGHQAN